MSDGPENALGVTGERPTLLGVSRIQPGSRLTTGDVVAERGSTSPLRPKELYDLTRGYWSLGPALSEPIAKLFLGVSNKFQSVSASNPSWSELSKIVFSFEGRRGVFGLLLGERLFSGIVGSKSVGEVLLALVGVLW